VKPSVYAVPDNPNEPFPVEPVRICGALKRLGYLVEEAEGAVGLVVADGVPFRVSLDGARRFISVRTTWDPALPYALSEGPLFALADSWNRERYFPTMYVVKAPSGSATVIIDYVVDCRDGFTDRQLDDVLRIGFQTSPDAVFYMQDAAESILGLGRDTPILPV
jgi:hypothetical protein